MRHKTNPVRGIIMKYLMLRNLTLVAVSVGGFGGCAGVNFYSDSELTMPTGIPVYAPKPYLLLARTGAKEKPVDVSIIYLNDTTKVVYAKPRSGFGTAKLNMALTNGQMTSFGQETDMNASELITAFSGIVTAQAGAGKMTAEATAVEFP